MSTAWPDFDDGERNSQGIDCGSAAMYPLSATLTYRGVQIGLLAWGAKHTRNFISFSGNGCARVKHWNVFYGVLDHVNARITRIDLAFDTYKGEVTYADCEAAACVHLRTCGGCNRICSTSAGMATRLSTIGQISNGDATTRVDGRFTMCISSLRNSLWPQRRAGRRVGFQDVPFGVG